MKTLPILLSMLLAVAVSAPAVAGSATEANTESTASILPRILSMAAIRSLGSNVSSPRKS